MKKSIIFLFAMLCALDGFGQGWTEADELGNRSLGLRLGTGVYSIFGGELQNPRPKAAF